jgi:hypothetical protein
LAGVEGLIAMDVYVVIASPPKGCDEPWVSDVFADVVLAKAYTEGMNELCSGVRYHVEKYAVRTSLDVEVPDAVLETEPSFRGLKDA